MQEEDSSIVVPIERSEDERRLQFLQANLSVRNWDQQESRICSICLDMIRCSELIAYSEECQHIFHESCLLEWLMRCSNCPECRQIFLIGLEESTKSVNSIEGSA